MPPSLSFLNALRPEHRPLLASCSIGLHLLACSSLLFLNACTDVTVYPLSSENDGAGGSGGAGGGSSSAGDGNIASNLEEAFQAGPNEGFITTIEDFSFGEGQSFGQDDFPDIIYGPPLGGGLTTGSLDVVSLGDGGSITFSFERNVIDGPGTDFIIFENPFQVGTSGDVFSELGEVSVSDDGFSFVSFDCDSETGIGCAGLKPVLLDGAQGGQGPLTSDQMGGDAFDLADLDLKEVVAIRITDLSDDETVFDLDAAIALHLKAASAQP